MNGVNAQDLLFALARDANMNVDIHPGIQGSVTMNVKDQTLTEILDRVARQVDMRYEVSGRNLSILPDHPYLKHYRIDYPNIKRSSSGRSSSGDSVAKDSSISIENASNHNFWETLKSNLTDLLRETDKVVSEGSQEQGKSPGPSPQPIAAPPSTAARTEAPTGKAGPRSAATDGQAAAVAVAAAAATAAATAAVTNAQAAQQSPASTTARTVVREAASVVTNPETGIVSVRATQAQH
ncbi:MAG: type II and III secretion system protein, partial [Rhodoferax sp.]|nr:type II and III secretion system protein [Rhodoferax sp.]